MLVSIVIRRDWLQFIEIKVLEYMKKKVLALMVPALLMASAANAAEIYNKNGNKLGPLRESVDGLHTSDDAQRTADQTYKPALSERRNADTSEHRLRSVGMPNTQRNTSEKEGAN